MSASSANQDYPQTSYSTQLTHIFDNAAREAQDALRAACQQHVVDQEAWNLAFGEWDQSDWFNYSSYMSRAEMGRAEPEEHATYALYRPIDDNALSSARAVRRAEEERNDLRLAKLYATERDIQRGRRS